MQVKNAVLDFLTDMFYATGMSSASLISFFNQYGLNRPQVRMLESKRVFARDCLAELNKQSQLKECIIDILNPAYGFGELGTHNEVITKLNRALSYDGYQVIDTGDRVDVVPYRKNPSALHLNEINSHAKALNHESLLSEIKRIEQSIQEDPSLAIGSAKEMVESVCKAIFEKIVEGEKPSDNLPQLVKRICKELKLAPSDVRDSAKGAESIKLILSNLSTIAQHIAELRNLYGSGHGKSGKQKGLAARHARLAVGAASTLALFLLETYEENKA